MNQYDFFSKLSKNFDNLENILIHKKYRQFVVKKFIPFKKKNCIVSLSTIRNKKKSSSWGVISLTILKLQDFRPISHLSELSSDLFN